MSKDQLTPIVVPSTDSPVESSETNASTFWRQAFALKGSITLHVLPNVCFMGVVASLICGVVWLVERFIGVRLGLTVAPYEFIGAALSLLLLLRTNAGYDRWWEGRKLWGGIVNQCRNLAISGMSYGPKEPEWQADFVRWIAVFPHAARASLRGQKPAGEILALVGTEAADQLSRADHMPSAVSVKLASLLREGCKQNGMDGFAFIQLDRERAALIDHIGACERIMKAPLPLAYCIKIRRFIAIFLLTLPLALIHEVGNNWLVPALTMLVAYPLFSLDQLGLELQNPFNTSNLSHLPLDEISATIERNVMAITNY